jgi:hypothetical protein
VASYVGIVAGKALVAFWAVGLVRFGALRLRGAVVGAALYAGVFGY